MFQYEAEVLEVLDGDTIKVRIDLGFHVFTEQTVRLARINTPETVKYKIGGIYDPAKVFFLERCPIGSVCVLYVTRVEKYGRWLADVLYLPGERNREKIIAGGRVLNDELVAAGLAKPYDGGRK